MKNKGLQSRKQIIDKSLQLFTVKGYFNSSISDIIETTKLTKGCIYGHFRSKEDIWYGVYDEAVKIWRNVIFKDVRSFRDPIIRIEKTIENFMQDYLGSDVFDGGCFFLNMLVELSGQSTTMSQHILRGFIKFSKLLQQWLEEAKQKEMLKDQLNFEEISNFIIISMNGTAALYSSTKEPNILRQTLTQLLFYTKQLRR